MSNTCTHHPVRSVKVPYTTALSLSDSPHSPRKHPRKKYAATPNNTTRHAYPPANEAHCMCDPSLPSQHRPQEGTAVGGLACRGVASASA